jgi:hypothetical protein
MYGDVCMGVSSVRRWAKHFKDGNTDVADQPRCGRPRTAATDRNKQKVDELTRQERRVTFREIAAQLGVGHHTVLKHDNARPHTARLDIVYNSEERLGTALPSTLQVRIWPPQTTTCSGPWKITWEVITMGLTQSRKPCEAGCEELERTYTAEASLRFCNADKNA